MLIKHIKNLSNDNNSKSEHYLILIRESSHHHWAIQGGVRRLSSSTILVALRLLLSHHLRVKNLPVPVARFTVKKCLARILESRRLAAPSDHPYLTSSTALPHNSPWQETMILHHQQQVGKESGRVKTKKPRFINCWNNLWKKSFMEWLLFRQEW